MREVQHSNRKSTLKNKQSTSVERAAWGPSVEQMSDVSSETRTATKHKPLPLGSGCLDLEAPIIVLVEAKKDEPTTGFGQCVAEMIAAQRFNAERGNDLPCIYGAATTGTMWQFLKLEARQLYIDSAIYSIGQCDKILGILASMVEQKV